MTRCGDNLWGQVDRTACPAIMGGMASKEQIRDTKLRLAEVAAAKKGKDDVDVGGERVDVLGGGDNSPVRSGADGVGRPRRDDGAGGGRARGDIVVPAGDLRAYRDSENLTQRAAADLVGVVEKTWARWEKNGPSPYGLLLLKDKGVL